MRKFFSVFFLSIFLISLCTRLVFAASLEDCDKEDIPQDKVTECIDVLSNKVSELGAQKKTLASQVAQFDSQIQITQLKISEAQATIDQLEKEIGVLGFRIGYITDSVDRLETLLKQRIVATYQQSFVSNFELLLTSKDFSDFVLRVQYLRQVQENDKKILSNLEETKSNYANQKDEREVKQKAIEDNKQKLLGLKTSLDEQKVEKQKFLEVTKNDEAKFQQLLEEAQAQASAFKSYAAFQGGGILPAQSSPDGWFYNQRDERWGNNKIGGSNEQVWDVGCLLTSVAMVMKKHGQNVSPADIASNRSYFFSDTAYMLIPWAGGKFSSPWGFDQSTVDAKLTSGEPVIVGLRVGPYGMHFVVLKSGSGGNYIMNDPWNGPDLKFTDYYTTGEIFQYGFYTG